jgi:hypothetical protein
VRGPIIAGVLLAACNFNLNGVDVGGANGGSGGTIPVADDAGVGGNGGVDMGARSGGIDGGPPAGAPCYSEDFSPTVSLADLASAYTQQVWKADVLASLDRRIPGGHSLLMAQQNDSQLGNFADASSFAALMSSLNLVCNAETSIYDYAHATGTTFSYFMRADLTMQPANVTTFPRSEIAQYITDNATATYDGALSGQQGSQDLTALADDLTSYTNGLGCIVAVADAMGNGVGARDGMAASIYYLELYLKRARTAHPTVYAALQASSDWQKMVRLLWARGAFWRKASLASPSSSELGIADAPIWAHVDDPSTSSEIAMFAGDTLSDIECHP